MLCGYEEGGRGLLQFCEDVMKAYNKSIWYVEQVNGMGEKCARDHKTRDKVSVRTSH